MLTTTEIKVEAPFDMANIKVPDFSNCDKQLITDFGAAPGDKEKTSQAIAHAIAEANGRNGGIIIIPDGEWLTGKIHLKSHVNLHLEKGASLVFSENPDDYLPPVHTTWEGIECYNYSPLIYAYECKNIAITGHGELKAKMNIWSEWFSRPEAHLESLKKLYYRAVQNTPVEERLMVKDDAHLRPPFIQFNRCKNILLEGVSITNSPFWTIHPYLSNDVIIRKVKVSALGHNNDGVDPDMSQNMLIEDCIFVQGDDAIAIKSGRNHDAWRLNTPSRNIVIRNCVVENGHQLVAIGSELSGGVENVFIDSCKVADGAKLYHLLNIKTNERRGGFVRNIHMRNVSAGKIDRGVLGIATDVLYQWRNLVPTIERRLTSIKDIHLTNVKATSARFISKISGQKEMPVENIYLSNVLVDCVQEEKHIHQNTLNFNEMN